MNWDGASTSTGARSFFLCLRRPGSDVAYPCAHACVVRVNQPIEVMLFQPLTNLEIDQYKWLNGWTQKDERRNRGRDGGEAEGEGRRAWMNGRRETGVNAWIEGCGFQHHCQQYWWYHSCYILCNVAGLRNLYSDRFPMCSSSFVFTVRVIVCCV